MPEVGHVIGIVGGVGPQAGIDLASKITSQTIANRDHEHLSLALLSLPESITERTDFLQGAEIDNPGVAIARIIVQLERCGATVIGIPCNTAHAPAIYDVIKYDIERRGSVVNLVDMVAETVMFIRSYYADVRRVGILATTGAQQARVYSNALERNGMQAILPNKADQERIIHPAITDENYGIKACSHPVSERARIDLLGSVCSLVRDGAEVVVLGCTEIPLAIKEKQIEGVTIVDPTLILARALIHAVSSDKLLPLR